MVQPLEPHAQHMETLCCLFIKVAGRLTFHSLRHSNNPASTTKR
jgi:hypothetical protein